jgi:hypothetical protein
MSHQYSITVPYQQSDNIVFVLTDNRVDLGLNNLGIDLQFDTDTNQIQFFASSTLQALQALLPDIDIVQEY